MTTLVTPLTPGAASVSEAKRGLAERLCERVQTVPGRLALVLIFTLLLKVVRVQMWWESGIVLALLSAFPRQRRPLLTIAAICWIFVVPPLLQSPLYEDQLVKLAVRDAALPWVRFG